MRSQSSLFLSSKRRKPKIRSLLSIAFVFLFSLPALAVEYKKGHFKEKQRSAWSFGLRGYRHSLKAGDGNSMLGNASAVAVGYGYISDIWYFCGTVDILLGPYQPSREEQLNTDFEGTGFTLWSGFSAQNLNLRSQEGGYGFALGFGYQDIVGRSYGKNRIEETAADDKELIDNYTLRITNFSLIPAIFFSWLGEERTAGNKPADLITSLEGYFLTLGMAMPLQVSYSAKYESRQSGNTEAGRQKNTEKGLLTGYSIILEFSSFLGT